MDDNLLTMYLIAQEEYYKLSKEDQTLYTYIKQISYIKDLMRLEDDKDIFNIMMNFKTKKELGHTNISFDIVSVFSEPSTDPFLIYKVNGSVFETEQVKNFILNIFTVSENQSETKQPIFKTSIIHQNTKISNSISLIENIWNFEQYETKSIIPLSTTLKIVTNKGEEIEIPVDNYYYQLYKDHKIDVITFIHFILMNPQKTKTYQKKKCKKTLSQQEIN